MNTSKTILLHSGWQTVNIGDIGHTPGTLRYLERHIPEARLLVHLAHTTPAIDAMLHQRFPAVEWVGGASSSPAMEAALQKCDAFIYNSGMHYNRFWNASPHWIDACSRLGKPLCLWGQSFDGFAPENEVEWAAKLGEVALIYTREADSLEYLRRIGARPGVLEFGPDGCFGIDVRDDVRAAAFLQQHGLDEQGFIVVILRTNTPKSSGRGDVLNPQTPTPEEIAQDERWAAQLREVIVAWVRATGKRVLLAPETDKEIAPAKRLLLDRLPNDVRPLVVHRDRFWNADEAASVYARACALISMEPHSPIIALANGTPSIHFFARKHGVKAAMFRDIGLSEWLLDIEELPARACIDALLAIEGFPQRARAKVRRAMNGVHARSAEMAADLRRVLGLETI